MADISTAIRGRLAAVSAVTDLAGTRIYPVKLPQKPTYPALSYLRVGGERLHDLDGSAGIARSRYQVDCWAETYAAARGLADAVRGALDDFAGAVGGVEITEIYVEGETDLFEDKVEIYRISIDFQVWHKES